MKFPTDKELFLGDDIPSLKAKLRNMQITEEERRRAKLFLDLANLIKRFINERVALEERLSARGMAEFSAAIYSLQWDEMYYGELARQEARRALGYWKRLWLALRGK